MVKVFIKTYGCPHNYSDSEVMKGILESEGFEVVENKEGADVVLFNTCTVKDPTESKFLDELRKTEKEKKVVIAGCIPQSEREKWKDYAVVGVKQIEKAGEAVRLLLEGKKAQFYSMEEGKRLNLPKKRRNRFVEIIPINSGCLGGCSFCKTVFARGRVKSYGVEEIVKQFRKVLEEGVREFWLTSEDLGAYGVDTGESLPSLLKRLLFIEGDYKIRLGMINPDFVLKYRKELVEIFKDERVYKFLHMPLQSGNDRILRLMKRKYTVKEFRECVEFLKENVEGITIATDIICGFPTESEEEFEDTLKLVKELGIPVMNISKFSPRRGTLAEEMEKKLVGSVEERNLLAHVKSERAKKAREVLVGNARSFLRKFVGRKEKAYFTEKGKHEGEFLGRIFNYAQVVVDGGVVEEKDLLGREALVFLEGTGNFELKGRVEKIL